jgi:hypothetical protein
MPDHGGSHMRAKVRLSKNPLYDGATDKVRLSKNPLYDGETGLMENPLYTGTGGSVQSSWNPLMKSGSPAYSKMPLDGKVSVKSGGVSCG